MKPNNPQPELQGQNCAYMCKCGKVHTVTGIVHYGKYLLSCGAAVWALQPKRNGPLKLFPWPGPALTKWELEEKEKAAAAVADSALRTPQSPLKP